MNALDLLSLLCAALLLHAYASYGWLLERLVRLQSASPAPRPLDASPDVKLTVLLAVHNEEAMIEARLLDLLDADIDRDRLQILVCSDGSDDATETLARSLAVRHPSIEVVVSPQRVGKTAVQNLGLTRAVGNVLVFTDADTRFHRQCLQNLIAPFSDPKVGGTTGALRFAPVPGSAISTNQSRYWARELDVRAAESRLGWLCVATGACMAIRRELYRPPLPEHGDDCVLPLDVVLAGKRFIHVDEAVAWDHMPPDVAGEFRARVRMTCRNWRGTLSRGRLLNPVRYPGYSFALVSHKLLKWLTPLLLGTLLAIACVRASQNGLQAALLVVMLLGLGGAAIGELARQLGRSLPIVRTLHTFALLNLGFAVGGLNALAGRAISRYGK